MDYLQYYGRCYSRSIQIFVLNLIINGLPSILRLKLKQNLMNMQNVLNLIINGLPSIQNKLKKYL